ncbi:MAG: tyrosine-type recombinase/integrase [bacterium]
MKGSIRKREYDSGKVKYQGRFDIPEELREEDERTTIYHTAETRDEAEKWLAEQNYNYHVLDQPEPNNDPFKELLHDWLNHRKGDVKDSTLTNYRSHAHKHIVPEIGHIPLDKLSPAQIQSYLDQKKVEGRLDVEEGGLSGSTRHEQYTVIKSALDWGVRMQRIQSNPAEPVEAPTPDNPDKEFLDEQQMADLLTAIEDLHETMAPLYHLAVNTGMRSSELCGLRWSDVDLEESTLEVHQQLTMNAYDGDGIQDVKTKSSRRVILLAPKVRSILESHKKRQQRWRMKVGPEIWGDHDEVQEDLNSVNLVFTEQHGRPMRPDKVYRWFKKALEKADLPDVDFHSLRHSHASVLIKQGQDIKTIAERLGHSSVQFTLDTYGHLMEGMQEEAARGFANSIYQKKAQ